jgi:Flp pilus assembly protein TadD
MTSRTTTYCALAALAVGLAACASTSEPARTVAAASRASSDASTAEALTRIAQRSLDAGDSVSAVSMLKRAHEVDTKSPTILAELGRTLGSLDAWTEAADAYGKAAVLAPKDAAIRRGYGGALLALNQPELAEQEYRAAVAVKADGQGYCGLGVTLDLQGRHDEAEAAFRKAYQLDPKSAATRANLALSLALWDSSNEAIALLAPMAAAPDADSKQRQNLALVFGLAGELDQAAAIARIDLAEDAVRSNLAYYETLKAMPPVFRVRAIMGVHSQPPLPPRKPEYAATVDETPAPEASSPAPTNAAPKPAPVKPSRTASVAPKQVAKPVEIVKTEPAPEQENGVVEDADVTTHLIVAPQPTETKAADDVPAPSAESAARAEAAHSESAEQPKDEPAAEAPSPLAEPAQAPPPKPAG